MNELELEAAAKIMEDMYTCVQDFKLPAGFKPSIEVPMRIANLARQYHSSKLFNYEGDFAAGEPFYYRGIRCFATP